MNTSLQASKTPSIIVNEIRMMATTFKGTHFLLEGDDDCKFWKLHLKRENVRLVNCEGKPNLTGAANLLVNIPKLAVAGVYDADFDRLRGIAPHLPTMLATTDGNDLETTLLQSEALKKVLAIHAVEEKLAAFETEHNITAINYLEQTAREFGRLRFLNLIEGHNVDFDKLSPYRFVSIDDWSFNLLELQQQYAKQASISHPALESALLSNCANLTPWVYPQGHDAVCILAQGLRRAIGSKQMDEHALTKLLWTAFSQAMLQETTMYASLRQIEASLPMPLFA